MDRRVFVKWATHGLGAVFGAVLGVPAIAYLIDPRNRPAPPSDFRTVARLSELEANVPHQVVIRDVRRDAWTLHPNDEIGRVWLIKRPATTSPGQTVDAFTSICPHLGCSINFEAKDKLFLCPCHGGKFDLNGDLLPSPPPRGMDRLECEIVGDTIRVKYQNFEQGKSEKIVKA